MATLSIRIEEKTKKAASKTLAGLGLDMSSAVKLFLNQVVVDKGLPFQPSARPRVSRAVLDKEFKDALKNGKRYTSGKALLDDLLK